MVTCWGSFSDGLHHPHPGVRLCVPPRGPAHLHRAPQVSDPSFNRDIWYHSCAEFGILSTFISLILVQRRRGCSRCPTSPSSSCTPCISLQLSLAIWPLKVRAAVPGTVLEFVFTVLYDITIWILQVQLWLYDTKNNLLHYIHLADAFIQRDLQYSISAIVQQSISQCIDRYSMSFVTQKTNSLWWQHTRKNYNLVQSGESTGFDIAMKQCCFLMRT